MSDLLRALFDVNFLIALFQPDHVHNPKALAWWEKHRSEGWASCPLTENGFARVVSQQSYGRPLSVAAALRYLAEQAGATDHQFWPDHVSMTDPEFFDHDYVLGPKQITDIYLLGLAVRHGGRLTTFDRSIPLSAVRGAEPHHVAL